MASAMTRPELARGDGPVVLGLGHSPVAVGVGGRQPRPPALVDLVLGQRAIAVLVGFGEALGAVLLPDRLALGVAHCAVAVLVSGGEALGLALRVERIELGAGERAVGVLVGGAQALLRAVRELLERYLAVAVGVPASEHRRRVGRAAAAGLAGGIHAAPVAGAVALGPGAAVARRVGPGRSLGGGLRSAERLRGDVELAVGGRLTAGEGAGEQEGDRQSSEGGVAEEAWDLVHRYVPLGG